MQPCKSALLWIFLPFLLWNCEGAEGPPGPVGPQGPNGPAGPAGIPGPQGTALMYEVSFDLDSSNQWETYYTFPAEDPIYLEDVVLVYLLWDQVETDGDPLDVWRLMPVNYFYDEGILQLNYDFTVEDIRIFAEAGFPLDPKLDVFTNFLARIVVVPAAYSPNARRSNAIDYENYEAVKQAFGLPDMKRSGGKPFMQIMKAYKARKH